MARIASEKYANRRVRSFNLDEQHFRELKRIAAVEELSMSDILNRVLSHGLAKRKVAVDVANGLQTTLELHTHDQRHRDGRKDGKCNPKSELGRCVICWGELS